PSSPRTISGSSSTIRMRGMLVASSCGPLTPALSPRGRGGDGQGEGEAAALLRPALDAHPAPVGLNDVLDQGQPHAAAPRALGLAPSDAIELLEDSLELRGRTADALRADLYHDR